MPQLITTPITADLLTGMVELERTEHGVRPHRLPERVRQLYADPQLAMAESEPSGVRVTLRTAATVIELVALPTRRFYPGAPVRADGSYDLIIDGELVGRESVPGGNVLAIDMATGSTELRPGDPGTVTFTGLRAG